jgi:hypothetical protein
MHVGFLGAHPPAVKGLGPLNFAKAGQGDKAAYEFSELALCTPAWGPGALAIDSPHPSCFSSGPRGWSIDPERLVLHLQIRQRQHQTPGMTYLQAICALSSSTTTNR